MAHISLTLVQQTVACAHVLSRGRDPAQCRLPSGMCVGREIPRERSPARNAAHGEVSSSSDPRPGLQFSPSVSSAMGLGTSTCHRLVWPPGDLEKRSFLGACSSPCRPGPCMRDVRSSGPGVAGVVSDGTPHCTGRGTR